MEPLHKVFTHNKNGNGLCFTLYLDKMDSYILTSKGWVWEEGKIDIKVIGKIANINEGTLKSFQDSFNMTFV